MKPEDLNLAFNSCLEQLQAGVPLETVLRKYPQCSADLRPVLEAVMAVWEARGSDTVPVAAMARSRAHLAEEVQRRLAVAPPINFWQRWYRSLRFATVPMVIVLAVIGFGLSGLASVKALPGEAFYPVKLAAERFTLSLPASADVRLAREESFDNKRLQEVEALSEQQREQEVEFSGFLTLGEDQVWRIGKILLDVKPEMRQDLTALEEVYVIARADLLQDGSAVLQGVEPRLYTVIGQVQQVEATRLQVDGVWIQLAPEAVVADLPVVGQDAVVSAVRLIGDRLQAVEIHNGKLPAQDDEAAATEQQGETKPASNDSLSPTPDSKEGDGKEGHSYTPTETPGVEQTRPPDHEENKTPKPTSSEEGKGGKTPQPGHEETPTPARDH